MSGSPAAAYLAQPGDRIRINVVARSGKTTTYVILARRILQRDPESCIACIVFNQKARQEATARFQSVHVVTDDRQESLGLLRVYNACAAFQCLASRSRR